MILGVTALLDANILYSACLRDFLLRLAAEELYRPLWSAQIQDEWTGRLLVDRPDLTKAQTDYTTGQMDKYFGDARVIGYGHLVEQVHLPDPDDRHVLAAAMQGGAQRIVTWNLKDFPLDGTLRYAIEAQCPDEFVMELLDASPQASLGLRAITALPFRIRPDRPKNILWRTTRPACPGSWRG